MPAFRLEAETPEHSNFLEEVLVGMLLGDAWLEKQKVNARFRFEQSHIRTEFFFDVFKYFAFYSPNTPKLRERLDKRTGKYIKLGIFLLYLLLYLLIIMIYFTKI